MFDPLKDPRVEAIAIWTTWTVMAAVAFAMAIGGVR